MSPTGTAPDDPGVVAATQLLTDLRGEITRADAKATILVGVLGMSAGVLCALLIGRGWSPALLSAPAALLWWAGTALLVTALFASLLAVIPRYRAHRWAPGRPLTYFGDVRQAARTGRLAAALAETGRDPGRGLLLALAETSGIAARKHFWIRAGLIAFGCATVLLPGSLLIA
ncbi:hypothetical protein QFZ24_005837 [Streptomyces phaeochromogenes]|jgi:hypothetical protein|uniref:Pycsar system effector family protein n=1 Tax=Streptomyces phaeochromogenes TaxID=1923 RepID=UPI0027935B74|nr:Pycsar system effector family protein [Streptomyces phaeochromogenes]MDQ0951914.1 hypothetical protein [Streptomyces phaeochromogenes]WRZ31735.1 DUF5706 domain-containing protein [Streptomyces phaeochromogenes]